MDDPQVREERPVPRQDRADLFSRPSGGPDGAPTATTRGGRAGTALAGPVQQLRPRDGRLDAGPRTRPRPGVPVQEQSAGPRVRRASRQGQSIGRRWRRRRRRRGRRGSMPREDVRGVPERDRGEARGAGAAQLQPRFPQGVLGPVGRGEPGDVPPLPVLALPGSHPEAEKNCGSLRLKMKMKMKMGSS